MPSSWTPPSDPSRPDYPYFPGFTTEITSHTPPRPFRNPKYEYSDRPRGYAPEEFLNSVTQTEVVLTYPPLETVPSNLEEEKRSVARLTIEKSLVIGNARPGQIVRCTITSITSPDKPSFTAVAKIFDALYYPFQHWAFQGADDVCLRADEHYSCEAGAYEQLQQAGLTVAGDFAPEYFGSWTFTLPLTYKGITHHRPVRLVLIEALNGSSIYSLFAQNHPDPNHHKDGFHFPEDYRLHVLNRIIEGEIKQACIGVTSNDIAPRNIILIDPSTADARVLPYSLPRVVLVDYNRATVYKYTKRGRHLYQTYSKMPNPMQRCWDGGFLQCCGWAPDEFLDSSNPQRRWGWLLSKYGGENMARYAPLDFTGIDQEAGLNVTDEKCQRLVSKTPQPTPSQRPGGAVPYRPAASPSPAPTPTSGMDQPPPNRPGPTSQTAAPVAGPGGNGCKQVTLMELTPAPPVRPRDRTLRFRLLSKERQAERDRLRAEAEPYL